MTLPDPEQFVRDSLFAAGIQRASRLAAENPPPSRDDDFRDLVRRMRAAQRDYFRGRDRYVLAEAQRLEREVDAELARDGSQGLLFPSAATDPASVAAPPRPPP